MANIDVTPFGPDGVLPSGYPIVDNCATDRADQALSARQGYLLATAIEPLIGDDTEVDEYDYNQVSWIISATNKWVNKNGVDGKCILIPIPRTATRLKIRVTSGDRTIAFLSSTSRENNGDPAFSSGYSARIVQDALNGEVIYPVTGNMNYLYVQTETTTGTDKRGTLELAILAPGDVLMEKDIVDNCVQGGHDKVLSAEQGKILAELIEAGGGASELSKNLASRLGNPLVELEPELDGNGYEKAKSLQVLNVFRKARQLTDIQWTPKSAVPKPSTGNFAANVTVTGLPYSSVKELDKFVGFDVSLHTFMTAVNNPYSLLYTENVSEAHSQSAWGKTYHGINSQAYYGITCSFLSSFCAGVPIPVSVEMTGWASNEACFFAKDYMQKAASVRIGDIYWMSSHDRIITRIKRDSSGEITNIEYSEATGAGNSVARRAEKTKAQFEALLVSESAAIYRHINLYKNIDYVPSPYVAVGDETPQTVTYNDDICCFAGDKAVFREGDTIALNYNLASVGAWTAIELYKGDTLLDTITIDTSVHVVDLTSMGLTYGKYKARMTDGENYSDYTYFNVVKTTVTAQMVDGILTMEFSSPNATPVYFKVCVLNGSVRAEREFTAAELAAGKIVCDVVKLNKQQRPDNLIGSETLYAKVYFQDEFGRITNTPIQVYSA